MSGAELSLGGVSKLYGAVAVVDGVSFTVPAGELLTLLGPSGCGKTTILRMIAGFVAPSAGRIELDGRNIAALPPERRETAMVFQSYALFPHLRLRDNVAFGLRMRRFDRRRVASKVAEALELVRLDNLADLYPHQMSGGQQQRAALARALVVEPKLLLLDEPFGALDRSLREQMQIELRKIQQALQITTLFVTHDQHEAFILSDRIIVMRSGRIEQIGVPGEIYDRPRTRFVAEFMGASNILDGRVTRVNGRSCEILLDAGARIELAAPPSIRAEASVQVAFRPASIRIASRGEGARPPAIPGQVGFISNTGARLNIEVLLETGGAVSVEEPRSGPIAPRPGDRVMVELDERDGIILEPS